MGDNMAGSSKLTKAVQYLDNLSPNQEKVATILYENKELNKKELGELSGLSDYAITKCVTALIQEGLVVETNKKRDKRKLLRWVGGVPAQEYELEKANETHIQASFLAEYYDSLITSPFSIFSILFEDNCWEVITNLQEGLNDVELSQNIGNSIPLDSVRRVLVIADAHNIIQLTRIREPFGNNIVKLFEPLYKISKVNNEFKDYLILIRGLASAMSFKIERKISPDYSHVYDPLLEIIFPKYLTLRDKVTSGSNHEENEILKNVINNYDFAPDMNRYCKNENWKKRLKGSKNIVVDGKTNHVLITKTLKESYKNAIK